MKRIPWVALRIIHAARRKRQAQPPAFVTVMYRGAVWIETVSP